MENHGLTLFYYPYKSFDPSEGGLLIDNNTTKTVTLDDLHTLAITKFPTGSAILTGSNDARIGSEGTYVVRWRFDQETLKAEVGESSYHRTDKDTGPMGGPWANLWAMQLDASLNIFTSTLKVMEGSTLGEQAQALQDQRWRIQTKFETPMLNFHYLEDADLTTVGTKGSLTDYEGGVNSVTPRGMWHQFGRIPKADEGVLYASH